MIRTFETKSRLLFAPKSWFNSVARWILGLHSETGTVRIRNTANPKAKGPSIDVDVAEVAKRIGANLCQSFPQVGKGDLLGPAFKWEGGKLEIDGVWLSNQLARLDNKHKEKAEDATDVTKTGTGGEWRNDNTSDAAAPVTPDPEDPEPNNPLIWKAGDHKTFVENAIVFADRPSTYTRLWYCRKTYSSDGRLLSVSPLVGYIRV